MLDFSLTPGAPPALDGPGGPHPHARVPPATGAIQSEERRREAIVDAVRHILRPRSVAVIGASRNPQDVGSRIVEGLRAGGFTGMLHVVQSEVPVIQDVPTVASIRDLPHGVDLAIVCVDAGTVLKAVDDCGQAGVRAVIVTAAGFAERGPVGRLLQGALRDLVRGYGMRLVGPNCQGVVNLDRGVRLHAACTPVLPDSGGISLASQRGALGIAVLDLAADRELGLSSFVSLGNKADLSSNDLLEYWEDDAATRVILLYLESFGNPWRFARIARRVGAGKPIVALKSGRTEAAVRSAGRHGVALADDDAVASAIFEQTGVIRADRIDEMFDIGCCLDLQPLPRGNRVAIVTNAAGPGILAADACAMTGLTVAPLTSDTRAQVTDVLPVNTGDESAGHLVLVAAPSDYCSSIKGVLRDPDVDSVIVVCAPTEAHRSAEILVSIGEAVRWARACGISEKPVLVCALTRKRRASPLVAGEERLPVYAFPESATRALAKITAYANWRRGVTHRDASSPSGRARTSAHEFES